MFRLSTLLTVLVLVQACTADKEPLATTGPRAPAMWRETDDDAPWGPWSPPVNLGPTINTTFSEQHMAISRDGRSLYFVSNRPGGYGGNDIWVSQRESTDDPWGAPRNIGPTINTSSSDFAPTFSRDGHWMYFNSDRPNGCGSSDIYVSHRTHTHDDFDWEPPVNLNQAELDLGQPCTANTAANESGPTFFIDDVTGEPTVMFTRLVRPAVDDWDIFQSTKQSDGTWSVATLVPELSTPFRDTRTAIRRDGLELFISSGRPGPSPIVSEDIWVSTRHSTSDPWSTPVNLNTANAALGGGPINSTAFDGAPALSSDGTTLYFFSQRPGGVGANDLYVTTRSRVGHSELPDDK